MTSSWPNLGAVVGEVSRPATRPGGPASGLRLGVKELMDVAGVVTTCGAPGLVDPGPATSDAAAVTTLLEAGAELVATTATHPFAYGIVTSATGNPRAPDRIAGGSSGGAAAGLAAGLWDVALGTDTGGSVRIPAACCGVVGLKTTRGAISVDGVQPLAPSLDTVGPLARSAATCALAWAVLAGVEVPPLDADRPLRVGLLRELRAVGLDDEVRTAFDAAAAALRTEGVVVVGVPAPLLPSTGAANARILAAEALQVHRERLAAFPDPAVWPADVWARLQAAQDLDPAVVDGARALRARWRADLRGIFSAVDVLLSPALPCRVPHVGEDPVCVAGRMQPLVAAMTRLANPWNLAGVPAGVVPFARDADGGPVAVQVIGPEGGEAVVLDAMARLERLAGGPWPVVEPPEASCT